MINWIKYMLALYLRKSFKFRPGLTDKEMRRYNHINGLILTKGGIRFRPDMLGWTKKEPYIKGMKERRKKNLQK